MLSCCHVVRYIVSTRIRTGRSVEGFPFNPNMTEDQYLALEKKATAAFDKMPDRLEGDYFPLTGERSEVTSHSQYNQWLPGKWPLLGTKAGYSDKRISSGPKSHKIKLTNEQ